MELIGLTGHIEIVRRDGTKIRLSKVDPAQCRLWEGDEIMVQTNSSAILRFPSKAVTRLTAGTRVRMDVLLGPKVELHLFRGVLHFLDRFVPDRFKIATETANTSVRGTEFVIEADPEGRSTQVYLLEGRLEVSNEFGPPVLLTSTNGRSPQTVEVNRGMKPAPHREIAVQHPSIQWFLYYPTVTDLRDLALPEAGIDAIKASIDAYRSGNVALALQRYPVDRVPDTHSEQAFYAALLVAAGEVEKSRSMLRQAAATDNPSLARVVSALQRHLHLITDPVEALAHWPALGSDPLPTEWMVESYALQARSELEAALKAAQRAHALDADFSYAMTRTAELLFSHGRSELAERVLAKSLAKAPDNANALALKGFLAAARNRNKDAQAAFESAIRLDSRFAQAWLGLGLCKIRSGKIQEGLDDLLVAAATEPRRSELRSYLGKAFSVARNNSKALYELELARVLDPKDPTHFLYRALVLEELNRVNEAMRELRTSREQNSNRSVFRSGTLLDQDNGVRGANQARIYQDAGLNEAALSAAMGALHDDPTSASSHLFLAQVYDGLRDPRIVDLRYESAWYGEYLTANLLAPAAMGILSPGLSQHEYSKLFERNRIGVTTSTEYLSSGNWTHNTSQWGIQNGFAYALDAGYHSERGERPNSDFRSRNINLRVKQEIGLRDTVFFQTGTSDARAGDVHPVYDPMDRREYFPDLSVHEQQAPVVLVGLHRAWSPEQHTLLLLNWVESTLSFSADQSNLVIHVQTNGVGGFQPSRLPLVYLSQDYRSEYRVGQIQAQHLSRFSSLQLLWGARFHRGDFALANRFGPVKPPPFIVDLTPNQQLNATTEGFGFYGYQAIAVSPTLSFHSGLSLDALRYPKNFRFAPLETGERTATALSPKIGIRWQITQQSSFRAMYGRSLGGVSLEESYKIDPSQIAGLNQRWRSLIPESAAASGAAERMQVGQCAYDIWLRPSLYGSLDAQWFHSDMNRDVGFFAVPGSNLAFPATTSQSIRYNEKGLAATLVETSGDVFSFGCRGRWSRAEIESEFKSIPDPMEWQDADLVQTTLFGIFHHPSGFFGRGEGIWNRQLWKETAQRSGRDSFWQFNLSSGWRWWQRRAELELSVLNLFDQDYRLQPLNLTTALPRNRTLAVSLKLSF